MIKRYRNSPSIILWSIGNEEWHLQNDQAEEGAKIAATMVRRAHELDPTREVSAAVNGTNEKGLSDALDIIGFNYNLKYPDDYHKKNPKRPLYGSETASAIATRGMYSTDKLRNTVSAYDIDPVPWGETAEEWWKFYGTREWEGGRLCLDGLRLSRRADAVRLAVDQLAVRHRGHLRFPERHLLLLQGLVG